MKEGWHWKPSEVAELRSYIGRRFIHGVGWGNGRSEIQEIADRFGRDYFAVYRKMRRIADEIEAGKLPRPVPDTGASVSVRLSPQLSSAALDRARSLGMKRPEYIRLLIREDLRRAKCSDASRRAKG